MQSLYAVAEYPDMKVTVSIPEDTKVLADQVDLSRVIANLLENSRRYGKSLGTQAWRWWIFQPGSATPGCSSRCATMATAWPPEVLSRLTNPFFRGDAARTEATGAGLGLAIAEKTVLRMGGLFSLSNTSSGGLAAHIKLRRG